MVNDLSNRIKQLIQLQEIQFVQAYKNYLLSYDYLWLLKYSHVYMYINYKKNLCTFYVDVLLKQAIETRHKQDIKKTVNKILVHISPENSEKEYLFDSTGENLWLFYQSQPVFVFETVLGNKSEDGNVKFSLEIDTLKTIQSENLILNTESGVYFQNTYETTAKPNAEADLRKILRNKFDEIYPESNIPNWIKKRIVFEFYPNFEKKILELNVLFVVPAPLAPEYQWEMINGNKQLVHIDTVTGHKSYVIAKDDHTLFYLFRANLNKEMKVEVLKTAGDLNKLNESDFHFWTD